jgi:hypothetical protein
MFQLRPVRYNASFSDEDKKMAIQVGVPVFLAILIIYYVQNMMASVPSMLQNAEGKLDTNKLYALALVVAVGGYFLMKEAVYP